MAISRDKKHELVSELKSLLDNSKMTVAAEYSGVSVTDMQELRRAAREAGVTIKVVKNRLVRVAMSEHKTFEKTDTSLLEGQLLYALSTEDEVAPAQIIAAFAKNHPSVKLIAGFDAAGTALNTAIVTELAALPTKEQLRGQMVGVIAAPLSQIMAVMNGAQRGFAQVLSQQAKQIG